jgi:hypothetical protein
MEPPLAPLIPALPPTGMFPPIPVVPAEELVPPVPIGLVGLLQAAAPKTRNPKCAIAEP